MSPALSTRIRNAMRFRRGDQRENSIGPLSEPPSVVELHRRGRVRLQLSPTQAMVNIKEGYEDNQCLPQADWTLLARYIQQGIEWPAHEHNVCTASVITLLKAFESLLESSPILDQPKKLHYYLQKMDMSLRTSKEPVVGLDEHGKLLTFIEAASEYLANPSGEVAEVGAMIARCLFVLLDQVDHRPVPLNAALRPYWPVLWRLAARGHYMQCKKPVRREAAEGNPKLPFMSWMFDEGTFQLGIIRSDHEIMLNLTMNSCGSLGAMYSICSYPKIAEFRYMLATMTTARNTWHGENFFAYTNTSKRDQLWFRDNGVSFGFTPEEWKSLNVLFDRAFQNPDIATALDVLGQEYGEF